MNLYDKIREMWQINNIVSSEALDLALDNFRILFA